jgi:hypothetical protein
MISSSRIGMVVIPKQLESKITKFIQKESKPVMKECVERIHHSLMSTGSPKLLQQAIKKGFFRLSSQTIPEKNTDFTTTLAVLRCK